MRRKVGGGRESSEGSGVFIPRQSGGSADLPEGAAPNPTGPALARSRKGPPFSRPLVYIIKIRYYLKDFRTAKDIFDKPISIIKVLIIASYNSALTL